MSVTVDVPTAEPTDDDVAAVRGFNRFYTRLIGVLGEGVGDGAFSLTEARVLFELSHAPGGRAEVSPLRERLGLDAGYLSRIVNRFERDGLAARSRSATDGRRVVLALTDAGRAAYAGVDRAAAGEVRRLLSGLDGDARRRLLGALRTVESVFGPAPPAPRGYLLRDVEPGDLGWIVARHGLLYRDEYGWDMAFEGFVARIAADYMAGRDRDPAGERERAWVAEVDGERAGCIACARDDDEVARLRLLLVEPRARGLGIGGRLVDECVRFARDAGYRRITLWTYDVLADARRLYQRAGFELDDERPERAFGHDLVQQNWSRPL